MSRHVAGENFLILPSVALLTPYTRQHRAAAFMMVMAGLNQSRCVSR